MSAEVEPSSTTYPAARQVERPARDAAGRRADRVRCIGPAVACSTTIELATIGEVDLDRSPIVEWNMAGGSRAPRSKRSHRQLEHRCRPTPSRPDSSERPATESAGIRDGPPRSCRRTPSRCATGEASAARRSRARRATGTPGIDALPGSAQWSAPDGWWRCTSRPVRLSDRARSRRAIEQRADRRRETWPPGTAGRRRVEQASNIDASAQTTGAAERVEATTPAPAAAPRLVLACSSHVLACE